MRTRTGVLAVHVVGSAAVGANRVEVTVALTADRAVLVEGGEAELVRVLSLTHLERNWNGVGFSVNRREDTVLGHADLDVSGHWAPGETRQVQAPLVLPSGQGTVAGRLVQQEYLVRVRVRVRGEDDTEATTAVRVPVAPPPPTPGDPAVAVEDAGSAVLGFGSLPERRVSDGVPVTGVLTVTPLRAGSARQIRVELVMVERVPAGAGEPLQEDHEAATVIAAVPVADGLELTPGHALRLPFTVPVPALLPAPSMTTPAFTVHWILRAVLDRPLRPDSRATVELYAGTTA